MSASQKETKIAALVFYEKEKFHGKSKCSVRPLPRPARSLLPRPLPFGWRLKAYMGRGDTIVASATAPGHSAIAVLRCSGNDAASQACSLTGLKSLRPREAKVQSIRDPRDGSLIDRGIIIFFPGPASYTGEDLVEYQIHGNPILLQRLMEALFFLGARQADPGEFTFRAYLAGKLDLIQAEALMHLINSNSPAMLAHAQKGLMGHTAEVLERLSTDVMALLARLEADLDFPEDMPELLPGEVAAKAGELACKIQKLASSFQKGMNLRRGLKVVLSGPPNVGKSSLFNALLGRQRALVCPEPGTTRDYIEESLTLRRSNLVLVDTAGIRSDAGKAESMGVKQGLCQAAAADLLVMVQDVSRQPAASLQQSLQDGGILVLNKCDLPQHPGWDDFSWPHELLFRVSALSGLGLESLLEAIEKMAMNKMPLPQEEEPLIMSVRQRDALMRAALALGEIESSAFTLPTEMQATLARSAMDALAEMGLSQDKDVLDTIFGSFCIGK